jgi:hypothetical protein
MARRSVRRDDYDTPWKAALHRYLPAFLAFFFPDIHADIDWSRGYQPLDKEFAQIIRRAGVGKQVADLLCQVWRHDGDECWLLVHIEVQSGYEKDFARRMFDYNTAAYRLYNREVVSLAVLCDERAHWRPTSYGYGRWGSWTALTFPIVKLLDYAQDLGALERSANPFAIVVLAHLQAQATRGAAEQRFAWKFRLVKALYERNLSKEDVRQLFLVIDWILDLPPELQEQFRDTVHRYELEKKMPYISSIERLGIAKGIAKGEAKGREAGLREGILLALETKFGAAGRKLRRKAKQVKGIVELRRLMRAIQAAQTIDEVREHLP